LNTKQTYKRLSRRTKPAHRRFTVLSTRKQAAIFLVINQGCELAEMPMRGKGSPHKVRVTLQDLAEVSQLRQDNSRNRRGEGFRCVGCGHEDDADHNAAMNLEYLGLAGVYSLRLLSS